MDFGQILMRKRDIPFKAVSTHSGMLWEWLVMPQGLSNDPATCNRCVTNLLRWVRDFAPSYFDHVFVHSRAMDGKSDVDVHRLHVRKVLTLMREHKLFANLKRCIFAAIEYHFLAASWVSTVYSLIQKRSRRLATGQCQSMSRDSESSLGWRRTYTSNRATTLR